MIRQRDIVYLLIAFSLFFLLHAVNILYNSEGEVPYNTNNNSNNNNNHPTNTAANAYTEESKQATDQHAVETTVVPNNESDDSKAVPAKPEPGFDQALDIEQIKKDLQTNLELLQKQNEEKKAKAEEEKKQKEKAAQELEKSKEGKTPEQIEKDAELLKNQEEYEKLKEKQRVNKLKDTAKGKADYEPLYKKYMASTVDTSKMTLAERIQNRRERYLAYMDAFSKLNEMDQYSESWKMEVVAMAREWEEDQAINSTVEWKKEDYVDGAIQPAGKKVLILTANDGKGNTAIGGVLNASLENRQEYCNYHGCISYYVDLNKYVKPEQSAVWAKMAAIEDAFKTYPEVEWVWWLDTDAIIMNAELNLAEHLLNPRALEHRLTYGRPLMSYERGYQNFMYFEKGEVDTHNIDFIISQDMGGFNAGSFFMRRSAFSDFLLQYWQDPIHPKMHYGGNEQDVLWYLFLKNERFQKHFGLVNQRIINSYSFIPNGVWTYNPGDFVLHLAGCWVLHYCEVNYHEFWNKRIQVPEKYRVANRIDFESMKTNEEKQQHWRYRWKK